jgi:hypothetical protein
MRIKLPESFQIQTYSGKPFNIHSPQDWNVDELVEIVKEDNQEYFKSLGFQVIDDVIKGLIINDIVNQFEALKSGLASKDEMREVMKQKIKKLQDARTKK